MVKVLVLFLVMVCVYLFYPFRDLYVKESAFTEDYNLVRKGYWTREACSEAAAAQNANDFQCRKRTNLAAFMAVSSNYSHYEEAR